MSYALILIDLLLYLGIVSKFSVFDKMSSTEKEDLMNIESLKQVNIMNYIVFLEDKLSPLLFSFANIVCTPLFVLLIFVFELIK